MNEAQSLLDKLVGAKSVTGDRDGTKLAMDVVEERLKKIGMQIYRTSFDGYEALVATTQKTKTPKVMLAGHIDVVPASDDMFKMQIAGDKIIGRGVWDMKSAIAGYILAAESLKDNLLDYDFGIMLSSDEEGPDRGIEDLIGEGYFPTDQAILFDGAENWQLEKAAKGITAYTVKIKDKTGHGSRPWLVNSASMRLIELLKEVKDLFADAGKLTNTLNLSGLESGKIGVAYNQIPAEATAMFEFRAVSATERDRLKSAIEKICQKYDAQYEIFFSTEALFHDESDPHYIQFAKSVKKVTGIENKGFVSSGGSSARYFIDKGTGCIVTWPVGGGHHSESEWIDVQSLDHIAPVITDYLQKMAKV
ncbi:MAG TPA: M20 family metallopeptidase [Candidatus Saccharimonadales bacterium]|nr:M20 family metallopeptidase [Candidatus Saccharimonadales bacterium]